MEREEVIKNLRACLLSGKGGVRVEDLNRDYKMVIDESIPYRRLGYSSLVAFLRTIDGIRMYDRGTDCYVDAIPSEASAHMVKLISQQRSVSKKSSKKKVVTGRRPTLHQNNYSSAQRNGWPARSGNNYLYMQGTGRQNVPVPLMSAKVTISNTTGKPRYMQSNSGTPPSPPSKRLKDRQVNVSMSNQSNNPHSQNKEKVAPPVISQIPKTANNNTEASTNGKTMSMTERLKAVRKIPSQQNITRSISPPVPQSQVLSPLNPAQALAGGILQYQQLPPISSPPPLLENINEYASKPPKSKPVFIDSRDELKARAEALDLPSPVYQIWPMKNKNLRGPPPVYARVKVGSHGYTSYPQEARTECEAQIIAAKNALLDLTEIYGSLTNFPETSDKDKIKLRVLAILDNHPNGIFMHQVPIYYKQQYNETLPSFWERLIEECPHIILEEGVDKSVILRRFSLTAGKAPESPPLKPDNIHLNRIGVAAPGVLELPETNGWAVLVTYIMSTVEVWVRLLNEYGEQFNDMTAEMMQYYSQAQQPVKAQTIEMNNHYAVFEDESWHRVRCVDYDSSTGLVTLLFIDRGDEDVFKCNILYPLDRKFTVLPAQAFRVCLFGLEHLCDCESALSHIASILFDRAFLVEVISRDSDEDGPFASVVFYDTAEPNDIDVNVQLSKQIVKDLLLKPKLITEKQVAEVFVSHVEANGDVFVQVQSESMKLLVNLLNRLIHSGLNADDVQASVVTTIDLKKIYFVSVDGNWYRGKVIDDSWHNHLRVYLIDFGKTVTTGKDTLLSLERLSEILSICPPQAIKVHLHNIDPSMFNEKMVNKLVALAPKDEPLLLKVVSSQTGVPVVELFKRIPPSNMLVSINNTLALEEEVTRSQGDGNNNIKPRKRLERKNSRNSGTDEEEGTKYLQPPKISGIGDYFDVHVTMAAHPGNFTVQPFDDKRSLEIMMMELQECCAAYTGPPPSSETVREGKIYAAKHTDGQWYRVCISSIIIEQKVTIYFCDYGDVSLLPIDKLQPLKSQFLELPYQAIKAKLAGIQPINVDWSVEDSLRFQQLVVEKNFVSEVVELNPGGLSPADTILSLKLIDVNTKEDIYIDRVLVEEGRAQYVD